MNCKTGDVEANLARAGELLSQVEGQIVPGRTVICLPELFSTGYNLSREGFEELAPEAEARTKEWLAETARELKAYLCGGYPEPGGDGQLYDSALLVSPEGVALQNYRKIHLAGQVEKAIFTPGGEARAVKTEVGGLGVLICYDHIFPELARTLALEGATILLHPSAWYGDPTTPMDWGGREFLAFRVVRAMENTVFMVSANLCGVEGRFRFVGRAGVIAPWGEVLADLEDREGVVLAAVEEEALERCRRIHPALMERRPDAYRL
jgi:predicted amidohydrolase